MRNAGTNPWRDLFGFVIRDSGVPRQILVPRFAFFEESGMRVLQSEIRKDFYRNSSFLISHSSFLTILAGGFS